MNRIPLASVILLTLLCQRVNAIHRGANDLPYSQSMPHPLDKEMNDKYNGKCFFMNLGPTGIRARIDPDAPKEFKVMYVFQDSKSPARGKIHIGDRIVGANGKLFKNPHGFHRKHGGRGWPGPPYELAFAIEDSQGKKGELELIVKPGGNGPKKKVIIQLKPVGRFSKTYPWNCPRSDKLRKDLCDFMVKNGINGREFYKIQQLLALWASGDPRARSMVKSMAQSLMSKRASHTQSGMVTWNWGYEGIFLGEYYHATKDRRVLPAVKALVEAYELGQDWRSGGFSHRPFPFIQKRIAGGGPKGYGSMAGPGGLSMLAQSIFKANGLPYSKRAYMRTHQAYLRSASNDQGSFAYGFTPWTHATLNLSNNSKAKSKMGVGYLVPSGMKDVGKYTIGWPTKNDPRYKPTDWVAKESSTNSIFEQKDWRLCVRTMKLPEPRRPFKTVPGGGDHIAPIGMGAAAHFIGNEGNRSWNWMGAHLAACCALNPKKMFDGHACGQMHAFFSVVGACRADKKMLRTYLDYAKTWIILSEAHNGGLVEQPFGCQRNSTCSIPRDRSCFTHIAVLLLSLPKQKLLITGAGSSKQTSYASRRPRVRKVSDANYQKLLSTLQKTLAALSKAGALTKVQVGLTRTRHKVWLQAASENGKLTYQLLSAEKSAEYTLQKLSRRDQANLAMLIAELRPESMDAKAMAGVFCEAAGRGTTAQKYYAGADDASLDKFEKFFN